MDEPKGGDAAGRLPQGAFRRGGPGRADVLGVRAGEPFGGPGPALPGDAPACAAPPGLNVTTSGETVGASGAASTRRVVLLLLAVGWAVIFQSASRPGNRTANGRGGHR